MSTLQHALPSVQGYVDHFSAQPLPVLRHTVRALDALRHSGESVGARQLAAIVLSDPLMTMRLLTHIERNRRQSQNHDITTIERAVMMLGVEPFFNAFGALPTLEDALAAHPKALVGVLRVITRARQVADHAREFAIVRRDLDVQEITVAALLHEATEIVCWIFAPELALQVRARQAAQPGLRTTEAERAVFGVSAAEIQLGLVRAWRLPELLVHLLDASQQGNPRVRTIQLASDFARHRAQGWDNPALPDDIAAIEALVHLGRETLLQRLGMPEDIRSRFLPAAPAAD